MSKYGKTKDGSYVHNCLIVPRADNKNDFLFMQTDNTVSCCLNGYAIIPIEEYERLRGEIVGVDYQAIADAEKQLHPNDNAKTNY